MKITVQLSAELLRRAKKKASDEGRTLSALLEKGLKAVLRQAKPARRKRVRFPLSKASGGTLPGVDLNRSNELEDRMHGL